MIATAKVLTVSDAGDLTVQASHAFARRMHQLGATRLADGTWHVPANRANSLRNLIAPPAPPPVAPAAASIPKAPKKPDVLPLEVEDLANWIAHLPTIDGLAISRSGFTVGFRLQKTSPGALEVLKRIPGRKWVPNHGAWEVSVRDWEQIEHIRGALAFVREALQVRHVRTRHSEIELIFSILDAPNLMQPVEHEGQIVVFEGSGRMFRIHEGHTRHSPRLQNRIGEFGTVLHGRMARPDEIETYRASLKPVP